MKGQQPMDETSARRPRQARLSNHLDGAGNLADCVHRIGTEMCSNAQAAEVTGVLEPGENQVALLSVRGRRRGSRIRATPGGWGSAFEVAFLSCSGGHRARKGGRGGGYGVYNMLVSVCHFHLL